MADLPEIADSRPSLRNRYTRSPPRNTPSEKEEAPRTRLPRTRPNQSEVVEVVEVEDVPRVRLPGTRRQREGVIVGTRPGLQSARRPNVGATPAQRLAARRFRGFGRLFPSGEPGSEEFRLRIYGRGYNRQPNGYVEGDWLNEILDNYLDPTGSYVMVSEYLNDYIALLRREGVAIGKNGEVEDGEEKEVFEEEPQEIGIIERDD